MSQIKLTLTGSDVGKLGVIVHENVENEITLCGKNIHDSVIRTRTLGNQFEGNNIMFHSKKPFFKPDKKYVLWLDASKIDLEKFTELF